MATYSSILAWKIPQTEELGRLQSMGSQELDTTEAIWHLARSRNRFSSVAQSCLTLCDPMDDSTPGFPVHHQLSELAQTHGH